jgi:hypothetical protein
MSISTELVAPGAGSRKTSHNKGVDGD